MEDARVGVSKDDAKPDFVEIDLVGHERQVPVRVCFTLDITDIASGWTETVSVRNTTAPTSPATTFERTAIELHIRIIHSNIDSGARRSAPEATHCLGRLLACASFKIG